MKRLCCFTVVSKGSLFILLYSIFCHVIQTELSSDPVNNADTLGAKNRNIVFTLDIDADIESRFKYHLFQLSGHLMRISWFVGLKKLSGRIDPTGARALICLQKTYISALII